MGTVCSGPLKTLRHLLQMQTLGSFQMCFIRMVSPYASHQDPPTLDTLKQRKKNYGERLKILEKW